MALRDKQGSGFRESKEGRAQNERGVPILLVTSVLSLVSVVVCIYHVVSPPHTHTQRLLCCRLIPPSSNAIGGGWTARIPTCSVAQLIQELMAE